MDLSERPVGAFRRHPWEIARARFLRSGLKQHGATRSQSVLDVGAGDGWFAQQLLPDLPASSRITCWDPEYARTPRPPADRGNGFAGRIEYVSEQPRGVFDLVIMLDVLEHAEDDRGFLAGLLRENIGPHTAVLLTVPAWQTLYSSHDARLKHHRRYAPQRAQDLLADAGLRVRVSGGLFHSLVVPRAARRLREAMSPPSAGAHGRPDTLEWRRGRIVTAAVAATLAIDNAISHATSRVGWSLPGLSWWALCERA